MPNPFASPLATIQRNIHAIAPVIMAKAGAIVVEFSNEAFQEQGWTDQQLEPWTPRKSEDAKDQGRAILYKTGRLRRSIRVIAVTADSVTIGTDVPYAQVHNEGFTGTVRVAGHIRMVPIKAAKGVKAVKFKKSVVPKHRRYMRMPQRKFLGNSHKQTERMRQMIRYEIARCFTLKPL